MVTTQSKSRVISCLFASVCAEVVANIQHLFQLDWRCVSYTAWPLEEVTVAGKNLLLNRKKLWAGPGKSTKSPTVARGLCPVLVDPKWSGSIPGRTFGRLSTNLVSCGPLDINVFKIRVFIWQEIHAAHICGFDRKRASVTSPHTQSPGLKGNLWQTVTPTTVTALIKALMIGFQPRWNLSSHIITRRQLALAELQPSGLQTTRSDHSLYSTGTSWVLFLVLLRPLATPTSLN